MQQQLIKTHGFYQQENRDDRKAAGKGARHASFMVRSRIPGGKLTSEQMLAELDVCDVMGNSTLRITSARDCNCTVSPRTISRTRSGSSIDQAQHSGGVRRREPQCHVLPRPTQ